MIAITGGGTGGHLVIARALANEFHSRGIKTIFIGSTKGQDKAWFQNDTKFSQKYFLQSSGVVNKSGFSKISALFNIIKLAFSCKEIFATNQIKAVVSVGGYSSAPASFAALFFKKPLFLHEQNAITGRLNQILKPFSKIFFSSYSKNPYPYPILDKFFIAKKERGKLQKIIFLGGSQGANYINELALNLATELENLGISIIHQCGTKELKDIQNRYEILGIKARVFDFSKDIEMHMNEADLCISRAGASTLWELCANALPAIFIPYPHAAKNHQFYNAKFLKDLGLCEIFEQNNPKSDAREILELIKNFDIKTRSKNLSKIAKNGGAKIIVDEILSQIS